MNCKICGRKIINTDRSDIFCCAHERRFETFSRKYEEIKYDHKTDEITEWFYSVKYEDRLAEFLKNILITSAKKTEKNIPLGLCEAMTYTKGECSSDIAHVINGHKLCKLHYNMYLKGKNIKILNKIDGTPPIQKAINMLLGEISTLET